MFLWNGLDVCYMPEASSDLICGEKKPKQPFALFHHSELSEPQGIRWVPLCSSLKSVIVAGFMSSDYCPEHRLVRIGWISWTNVSKWLSAIICILYMTDIEHDFFSQEVCLVKSSSSASSALKLMFMATDTQIYVFFLLSHVCEKMWYDLKRRKLWDLSISYMF